MQYCGADELRRRRRRWLCRLVIGVSGCKGEVLQDGNHIAVGIVAEG
jgi:hypothetical protein